MTGPATYTAVKSSAKTEAANNAVEAAEDIIANADNYDPDYIAALTTAKDAVKDCDDEETEQRQAELLAALLGTDTEAGLIEQADDNVLYTITWVNAGEPATTSVKKGDTPSHALPTKADDTYYTYSYAWSPALAAVTGETTYTAVESKTWNDAKQTIIDDAEDIVADANDPDTGNDYDAEYVEDIREQLDIINDSDATDAEKEAAVDALETLTSEENQNANKIYTLTVIRYEGSTYTLTGKANDTVPLDTPARDGFVFTAWTVSAGTLSGTNYTFAASNATATAGWYDLKNATDAIDAAQDLINDENDEYEDEFSNDLVGLVEDLTDALNADPQNADTISDLVDQINGLINDKDSYKHVYGAWTVYEEQAPTCTEAGLERRYCANCDKYEERIAKALGHDMGPWVVISEPTLEADGLRRRECSRCDYYEEEALPFSAPMNRQIQFVVSSNMHYVVYLRNVEYSIYLRSTPAIYWYDDTPLTFDVYTHTGWNGNVTVSVNGNELAPNADGSYTIPGGTDFVLVNAYPASSSLTPSVTPSDNVSINDNDVCGFCGKVHPNSLWGRIVAFFHLIFLFFRNIFK